MNGKELQQYFGTQINQLDSRLRIGSRDIFFWLNKAQTKMIQEAYAEFERDKRIGDILRPLQERATIYTTRDAFTGNDKATLPSTHLYPLALRAEVGSSRNGIEFATNDDGYRMFLGQYEVRTVICRVVQKDDIYRLLLDPFHTTSKNEPLSTFEKEFLLIYNTPQFLARTAFLEYVREAAPITRETGSELPEHHHQALVELAAKLFAASIGDSPRQVDSPSDKSQSS